MCLVNVCVGVVLDCHGWVVFLGIRLGGWLVNFGKFFRLWSMMRLLGSIPRVNWLSPFLTNGLMEAMRVIYV